MASGGLTFRDAMLPMVDVIRGIPVLFGHRLYSVSITVRSWSGLRQGLGANTDATSGLKISLGIGQVKVTQVTEAQVVASGGLYESQDMTVGPITPPFVGSAADNDAISVFDPVINANPSEVFFKIIGPGMAPTGSYFKKISQSVNRLYRYSFVVRRTSEVP